MMRPKIARTSASVLVPLLLLSACNQAPQEPVQGPDPDPDAPVQPDNAVSPPEEAVSILRPDVEAETKVVAPQESFVATIGFPAGGSEFDADALAALAQVAASQQFGLATPIILRAHSDSAGSDTVNERAAEARGLAVARWLIDAGADPERIDVIVFGEQNPIAPNALPNSQPNEAGRAANRRVEVEILPLIVQDEEVDEKADEEVAGSEPGNEP